MHTSLGVFDCCHICCYDLILVLLLLLLPLLLLLLAIHSQVLRTAVIPQLPAMHKQQRQQQQRGPTSAVFQLLST
jgi:hypothetical protein